MFQLYRHDIALKPQFQQNLLLFKVFGMLLLLPLQTAASGLLVVGYRRELYVSEFLDDYNTGVGCGVWGETARGVGCHWVSCT